MKEILIDDLFKDMRLDRFIGKVTNLSKGEIQKNLRKKNIKVNNKKEEGNYRTKKGDKISFYLPLDVFNIDEKIKRTDISRLDIIYEDENIIIINKPEGVLSQSDGKEKSDIVSMLKTYLNTNQTGIVTRLDLNTSGIVIAGKNRRALMLLNSLSKDNLIDKRYVTLVYGDFKNEGKVTLYAKKDTKGNKLIFLEKKEKDSFEVSSVFKVKERYNKYTLLEVQLITGKTHQIRAMLNKMGFSVVGDRKYNDHTLRNAKVNLKRQFLHCYKVTLKYNEKYKEIIDKQKEFYAPIPKEFNDLLNNIKNAQS